MITGVDIFLIIKYSRCDLTSGEAKAILYNSQESVDQTNRGAKACSVECWESRFSGSETIRLVFIHVQIELCSDRKEG